MSCTELYRDKSWLRKKYVQERLSTYDIAERCGCSDSTVRYWMDKHDIATRRDGPPLENDKLRDPDWLWEEYVERGKTCKEIAEFCECSDVTVYNYLQEHDIETRRPVTDERLRDGDWLRKQYLELGKSGAKIADEIGCSSTLVYRWFRKHGIDAEYIYRGPTGSEHPNWEGGRIPYGSGWNDKKRQTVRDRDGYTCQDPQCSVNQQEHLDKYGEKLHVHHLRKARNIDDPNKRNAKQNLITLCRDCHKQWEKIADADLVPQIEGMHQ